MTIKIICGQLEVIAGRPDLNYEKIIEAIKRACAQNADILLLPEMCLPGYLIGDIWEQQSFLDDCEYYMQQIIAASKNLCVIFGSVAVEKDKLNEDGRVRKYNAAFVCQNCKPLAGYQGRSFVIKNSLPNYREFDDCRYFYNLQKLCAEEKTSIEQALQPIEVSIRGQKLRIGIMLCEDGWTENYHINVPQTLANNGAQILCNLSCSPYTLGKNRKRNRLFGAQAQTAGIPLIYCNNVGIQNNGKNIFTYDGCSSAYNSDGTLVTSAGMYDDTLLPMAWDSEKNTLTSECVPAMLPQEPQAIYQALKYGTKKFLQQYGIKKMTVGLSGGIDSAVTAAMYADILGAENLLLVNLPSQYNSSTTRDLAQQMAGAIGANYAVLPITESYKLTINQLTDTPVTNLTTGKNFYLQLNDLIKENIQARDRGARLIAAASAAFGGAFSCNSNKAELAVGYATFYGDIAGALAMLGDLWKYQVYALGHYLNEEVFKRQIIPEAIFTIRPSAELSASQTVGTGGDPLFYNYHDYLLRAFIENWHKTTPADILRWYKQGILSQELGCTEEALLEACPNASALVTDLERWWKLFAGFAVAKRIQAPPVLSLTKRAFGYDHRESQLSPYFSREYYQLKAELLQNVTVHN